ncbi:MAG: hypothetical protein L6455_07375 [Kiritimatiellae bacterium]|nr:hypothetical protein [Verrucomicrobiota bacterium]MBU4290753.1 hypothetical protein [Verrucomicrobiota bacterium]MCG2679771.1 hypothetical protein [Kiritimatiellia bacterium]
MKDTAQFDPELTDYHVHCHRDGCASKDMTLAAIYSEAVKTGLKEICVVKHYSHALPNNGDVWVNWKRTRPEDFAQFLEEFRSTPVPDGLHALSGVETEAVSSDGAVNIPDEQAAKLDMVLVSNHWLPNAPDLSQAWQPLLSHGILPCSMSPDELAPWLDVLKQTGPEPYARALCEANANAVKHNPKVRVLSHLDDGFHNLRAFRIPVDELSDDLLLELTAPIMNACVAHQALWEITPSIPRRTNILREANRRGVRFTGTVDAHFLANPRWGHSLAQHSRVEETIRKLQLTRGRVVLTS